jgi:SAM-dependent methyltransferase
LAEHGRTLVGRKRGKVFENLTGDRRMWEVTATARRREAHRLRDSLIARWRLLLRREDLGDAANEPCGIDMPEFTKYKEEEVRRLNRLQAAYFSKNAHVFEPPLPEGVPERLERIVRSAAIAVYDSVLDVGTGTGILLPLIRAYSPAHIYANDLSEAMLDHVRANHPTVIAAHGDVADLALKDASMGVAFINACYPNIVDKHKAFTNLRRMMRPGGRLIISHPLGRAFVEILKKNVPFPLDDLPAPRSEARDLFAPYGFRVSRFIDEEALYLLRLVAEEPVKSAGLCSSGPGGSTPAGNALCPRSG